MQSTAQTALRVIANRMHGHDMGVLQPREDLRLVAVGARDLDRDGPTAEVDLFGEIDARERTAPSSRKMRKPASSSPRRGKAAGQRFDDAGRGWRSAIPPHLRVLPPTTRRAAAEAGWLLDPRCDSSSAKPSSSARVCRVSASRDD